MFSHIMVGCDDIAAAKTFYDAALGALGVSPGVFNGNRVFYRVAQLPDVSRPGVIKQLFRRRIGYFCYRFILHGGKLFDKFPCEKKNIRPPGT